MDLAALLIRAIEQNRDQLNTSRIADGEPGRVEIYVNPAVRGTYVDVVVPEKRRIA